MRNSTRHRRDSPRTTTADPIPAPSDYPEPNWTPSYLRHNICKSGVPFNLMETNPPPILFRLHVDSAPEGGCRSPSSLRRERKADIAGPSQYNVDNIHPIDFIQGQIGATVVENKATIERRNSKVKINDP